jgi:hypothetical protein
MPPNDDIKRRLDDVERRLASIERDMDHKLTVAEHLSAQWIEFEATGDDTNIRAKTRFASRPAAVLIAEVRNLDNAEAPGALVAAWRWAEHGQIEIYNFTGLASGARYRVRLLVIGG